MADVTTCERHGRVTSIACATCGAPICPRCLVRTPVGFKCRPCTGGAGDPRRPWGPPIAAALLTAAVIGLPVALALVDGYQEGGGRPPVASSPAAGVGDEVRDAGLTFVVRSFTCQDDADGQLCLMGLGAVNNGSGPEELFGGRQFLVDDVGRRYRPEETFDRSVEELNPGEEGELRLTFELPADVTIDEAELHTYPESLGARVRLDPTGARRWSCRWGTARPPARAGTDVAEPRSGAVGPGLSLIRPPGPISRRGRPQPARPAAARSPRRCGTRSPRPRCRR